MLFPVQVEDRTVGIILLHVLLDVTNNFRMVVSHVDLSTLRPLLHCQTCHTHSCAQLQHSFVLKEGTVMNDVSRKYDACFPQSKTIHSVRKRLNAAYLKTHLIAMMNDYCLCVDFEFD